VGVAFALVPACDSKTREEASAPVTNPEDVFRFPSPTTGTVFEEGEVLEPGSYALQLDGLTIAFEVPSGWQAWKYGVMPAAGGADPPAGSGLGFWIVDRIYTDPCRWNRALVDPGHGSQALARALRAARGEYASEATRTTLTGRPALRMEIVVPPDLDLSRCWGEAFVSWPQRDPPGGGRYHQGPGQHDRLWILDVDGTRLVVDASFFPGTTAIDRAELFRVVRSVHVD
jgi:hypothetical protein